MNYSSNYSFLTLNIITYSGLVLQDTEGAGDDHVLQHRAVGNVDLLALLADTDNGALESHALAEHDVTGDGQMVQLQNLGHVGDSLLEVRHLLVVASQLDEGRTAKSRGVHLQTASVESVQIGLDKQQIGTRLDGQETSSGDVDTHAALEVSNGGTNSGLELQNGNVVLADGDALLVGDDLRVELVVLNDTLDGLEVDPQVVSVEVLELLDGLELLGVLLGDLGNLEKSHLTVVVNQGSSLDIGSGLVGQLHDVLGAGGGHVLEDAEIHNGTQVIDVGNKDDLLALGDQLVKHTRVVQRLEQISVTGRVPGINSVIKALGDGQVGVLEDSGEPGLVEGLDVDLVALVLLDDGLGVVVGVERVHQNEGHVHVVLSVEVLNLSDREIEERLAVSHLNDGLGADTAHGGTETTVELEDSQLVEELGAHVLVNVLVVHDLLGLRGLDSVPVERVALGLVHEVSSEEREEVVHLVLESPLLGRVLDRVGQLVEGVSHLGCGHGGGGVVKGLG